MVIIKKEYSALIDKIGNSVKRARENSFNAINQELIRANWEIGKHIVTYEQKGKLKSAYGSELLSILSKDLRRKYGRGFSKSNLYVCRQFYIEYPIFQTVSGKLSWSHHAELINISDIKARNFYINEALSEKWSFREMKRQINSSLYERISISGKIYNEGKRLIDKKHKNFPNELVKDPYIFEFLQLRENILLDEKTLERKLINHLKNFLLELGKGFTFVGHQYKILVDNTHFFVDLVFYHRHLRCFILIELKTKKVTPHDIGQMNFYLNYFNSEENGIDEKEAIGIIIAADKNDTTVKYATGGMSNKIFVSRYQLYLPEQKLLENKIKEMIDLEN